ncbi:ethanolamine permease [Klebsiella quasipneumoniae]|nr:ethanolamine permease [Klebsiella quasipneumoniae]
MLVWLGLFGLVASFHGIIMGYSRQIYSLARAGYLPAGLATLNRRTRTPHLGDPRRRRGGHRRDLLPTR